jgi:hypothetical protein
METCLWRTNTLIMNGYASHVIVDVVNKAKTIGFDIITFLLTHNMPYNLLMFLVLRGFSPLSVNVMILRH